MSSVSTLILVAVISLARAQPADGPGMNTAPPTGLSRDVILVHGIEPNMRWRAFSEELVQGLETLGVELIILL
ncbi:MAG: PAC2 family protein, partial [Gemmatimonadales bacterium]